MDDETNSGEQDRAPSLNDPSVQKTIGYRRLRSPQHHGESLQIPPLHSVDKVWQSNLNSGRSEQEIDSVPLAELQRRGRAEIYQLAKDYSSSYLEMDFDRTVDHVVMAGHQPELFHPGVWYKNFVLSELGQRYSCAAINLVVDNDISSSASVRFPKIQAEKVSLATIPIDSVGENVPFEVRKIQDWNFFEGFRARVEQAIGNQVTDPVVSRLWPQVIEAGSRISSDQDRRPWNAIAAGRHRLENQIGLQTLEVPLSSIAKTESFATFARSILLDGERFAEHYNRALLDYRTVHRIKSRSHPVPSLESIEGWTEAPFWIWSTDQTVRQRLFGKRVAGVLVLSNRSGWEAKIESESFTEQFRALASEGIAVRPKALMTTMFSRMILCDLFLHGIGGAKYDQLTDVIASRFFSVELPAFLTLSATMKLPTDFDLVRRSDVVAIDRQVRELRFHPESSISTKTADAAELIRQKRDWIHGEHRSERSKEKHQAIEALNRELAKFIDVDLATLRAKRAESSKKLRASEILDSRDYSFCLSPDSLIEELKALATI